MRKLSKWLTVARGYETSTICQEITLKDAAAQRESFNFMDSQNQRGDKVTAHPRRLRSMWIIATILDVLNCPVHRSARDLICNTARNLRSARRHDPSYLMSLICLLLLLPKVVSAPISSPYEPPQLG
jgi:hypothetical protein